MKVIVITGASRGLGKAMALALRNDERKVIALGRGPAVDLEASYRNSIDDYFQVDIGDREAVGAVCSAIAQKHGRIHVLVNNAAVRPFKPFGEFQRADIEQAVEVNFLAPLLFVSHILPAMLDENFGRIINIASISGMHGPKLGSLYSPTKSALIIFTKSIACDLASTGKDVTANVICPGSFEARSGEKYASYDHIVGRVVKTVDNLIDAKTNGAVIIVETWPRRAKAFLVQIRIAFSFFVSSK